MSTLPRSAQPEYLAYQYSSSEKLRIRIETHRLYSRGTESYEDELLDALDLTTVGLRLLDVGCGPGEWHGRLMERGALITGVDLSDGMLREAAAAATGSPPRLVQGDAHRLPFRHNTFDRLFCSGVMYHLADHALALQEMRRVLRPGGLAIVTANGSGAMQRIQTVHAEAAEQLGYTPKPLSAETFTMDHLPLVQAIFPEARRIVLDGALVFSEPEPALRFYASNRIDGLADLPPDGSHRARLLPLVRATIERIIAAEGEFCVPKSTGWFVARA
jgi:ubiquinone/menaquinone biosynthesis C-methylase UbiE